MGDVKDGTGLLDTDQRLSLARQRVVELREVHVPLAVPCTDCRFGPIGTGGVGKCEHYAHWQVRGDPVTGARRGRVDVTTDEARSPEGLCGPEGVLFERRNLVQRAAAWASIWGPGGVWMAAIVIIAVLGGIAGVAYELYYPEPPKFIMVPAGR